MTQTVAIATLRPTGRIGRVHEALAIAAAIYEIEIDDVVAAIEDAGWCGVVSAEGEAAVLLPRGDALPKEAASFLRDR